MRSGFRILSNGSLVELHLAMGHPLRRLLAGELLFPPWQSLFSHVQK